MKRLTILIGISGSGKTSFRNKFIKANPETRAVSMDDIRGSQGDIGDQSKNWLVAKEANAKLRLLLSQGKSVIWDNTTLSPKYLMGVVDLIPKEYVLSIFYTERSLFPEDCIKSIQGDVASGINRADVPVEIVHKQADKLVNLLKWIKVQGPDVVKKNLYSIPSF